MSNNREIVELNNRIFDAKIRRDYKTAKELDAKMRQHPDFKEWQQELLQSEIDFVDDECDCSSC